MGIRSYENGIMVVESSNSDTNLSEHKVENKISSLSYFTSTCRRVYGLVLKFIGQ